MHWSAITIFWLWLKKKKINISCNDLHVLKMNGLPETQISVVTNVYYCLGRVVAASDNYPWRLRRLIN